MLYHVVLSLCAGGWVGGGGGQWRNQVGARGAVRPPWMIFEAFWGKFVIPNVLMLGKHDFPFSQLWDLVIFPRLILGKLHSSLVI